MLRPWLDVQEIGRDRAYRVGCSVNGELIGRASLPVTSSASTVPLRIAEPAAMGALWVLIANNGHRPAYANTSVLFSARA